MKTHLKAATKFTPKSPQTQIQTTLERRSISRSFEEKSGIKTDPKVSTSVGTNDDNSSYHNLGKINFFRSQHQNSKINSKPINFSLCLSNKQISRVANTRQDIITNNIICSEAIAIKTYSQSKSTHNNFSKTSSSIIQKFDPGHHRTATIQGLKGSFSAKEIGRIYQANWERDMSQVPAKVVNLMITWKSLKLAYKSGNQQKIILAQINFHLALSQICQSSFLVDLLFNGFESMGGAPAKEHMDNPGKNQAKTENNLPGYIEKSRDYIKDNIKNAVNLYQTKQDQEVNYDRVLPRTPIAIDTAIKAQNNRHISEEEFTNNSSSLSPKIADHIGRAMHATEDFFAHSNWVEMSQGNQEEIRKGLRSGTFGFVDKVHAVSHKLNSLANEVTKYSDIIPHLINPATRYFINYLQSRIIPKMEAWAEKKANTTKEGHAYLAKDSEEAEGFKKAQNYAIKTNKLIFAPLKKIMENNNQTEVDRLLDLVDAIIARPSKNHPLINPNHPLVKSASPTIQNSSQARQRKTQKPTFSNSGFNRLLRKGVIGHDVTNLQKALNKIGLSIKVDGIFGSETYRAVKHFQKQNSLSVDGIVGKNTRSKLRIKSGIVGY